MNKRFAVASALLAASLCAGANGSEPPSARIDNGRVHATVQLPDVRSGYYRGTRFDWSGSISQLEAAGHRYFGQWFETYDPHTHDSITGPVEDYAPLNYTEAKPGETFVKIGVGVLKKPDDKPYRFAAPYELLDTGRWSVRRRRDSVEYRHALSDPASGYGYVYTKILRLTPGKAQLTIEHRLKNTGRKAIATNVYNHGFYMLDAQATGPDVAVRFPFDIKGARDMAGLAEARGRQIVYLKELQDRVDGGRRQAASTPIEGFSTVDPSDFDITVQNNRTGAAVRVTSDRPLSRINFWSVRTTVCPEPYVEVNAAPGEEAHWRLTFDFYDMGGKT